MTPRLLNRRSGTWGFVVVAAGLWLLSQGRAAADDGYEENDSPEAAASIPTDLVMSGLVCEDDDWYRFSLGGCRHARVRVLFSQAAGDLNVELFDRRCVEPGEMGYKVGESYTTTDNETMTYVNVTGADQLFLKVYRQAGVGSVNYSVEVTTFDSDDALELYQGIWSNDSGCPGGWWGNLPAVQVDTQYDGLICRDDDWYRVDVSGWDTIHVWVEHYYFSGDLNVEVREAVDGECWPAVVQGSYGRDSQAPAEELSDVWVSGRQWVLIRVYGETRQTNFYSLTVTGGVQPSPTLAEAVDNPSLSFYTNGDASWFLQTATFNYGGDAAQSGNIGHSQETWMETSVNGPGTLTYWWKASSEQDADFLVSALDLSLLVNGLTGEVNWTLASMTVPPDWHTVTWSYLKDDSVDAGADCGWVDRVVWTPTSIPAPTSSLSDAVDNASLSLSTGGNASWFRQTATSQSGGDAAQSGNVSDKGVTWMTMTVTGPGTLSFAWKVSSELDYDYLVSYLDSTLDDSISGEQNWTTTSMSIPSGTHRATWVYAKDVSFSEGSDCGWVDNVVWTPGP